ncbi:hypothetical protein D9M71_762520 [compost metagenome]
MRQSAGFDIRHAFGGGIVDEFRRRLGEGAAGAQAQQRYKTGITQSGGHPVHGRALLLKFKRELSLPLLN